MNLCAMCGCTNSCYQEDLVEKSAIFSREKISMILSLLNVPFKETIQLTATHCITLQHIKEILQRTATHCNTLHYTATYQGDTATHCNTLQHTALHCNISRRYLTSRVFWVDILKSPVTIKCTVWIGFKADCNALQHTATHCNTLQHTATHCNTSRRNSTRECSG